MTGTAHQDHADRASEREMEEATRSPTNDTIESKKGAEQPEQPELLEDLEAKPTHATYLDNDAIRDISEEHRQYLLDRHGTLDLDPVPGFGDADPYNWPSWKVCAPDTSFPSARLTGYRNIPILLWSHFTP
jgi:hypothetical protein